MFGLLYARQSCANQPPGSDAVVVLLALARPTTEWHQHIQSRRFNPCVVAQISRGLTGMGARASGSHGRGRAAPFGLAVGAGREWSRAWVSWVCGEVPVPVRVRAGAGFGYRESPLGRVLRGASCTCGAAACYSPTPCRVQYHRRARP